MQSLRALLDKTIMCVCVIIFMEMTIVGTYQIISRYFFNSPSTISEELVTFSFTWLSILSAACMFGKHGHLSMSFFVGKFHGKSRLYIDMFCEFTVIITAIFLLMYGGYIMTEQNFSQETSSLGISMGLMYSVLPISGIIICIYSALNFADMLAVLKSPDCEHYEGVGSGSEG